MSYNIFNSEIVLKAKEYGYSCHKNVNQLYDGQSYNVHLNLVGDYTDYFSCLINKKCDREQLECIVGSSFTHDTIEDARQTFNNVLKNTNKYIADLTYAVTDEKGHNRDERKNEKFYKELLEVPFADYLKICDRLANTYYSSKSNSRMSTVYIEEYSHFKEMLYKVEYDRMFKQIEMYQKFRK